MNILITSATPADAEFFTGALPGHNLRLCQGETAEGTDEIEALAVVHGKAVSAEAIGRMPKLRLVVTRSTGYDHIDLAAARDRGIAVCNVPEYGSTTVAEFTFGLILSLARKIPQAVAQSREGRFSVDGLMGIDLEGKTLGIVGIGKIGRGLARMAEGFAMKVVAHDPYKADSIALDELLRSADFVALCCPLTPETHHLMDAKTLALMKPGAYLVNTARGPVVDSRALLDALNDGRLAGAALDVLEGEERIAAAVPSAEYDLNRALMSHPKAFVTPHLAFDSAEALGRIRATTAEILCAFAKGRLVNPVPGSPCGS
ncbi:2-hydroxyacid dehydrogenase [soil metagenome]